MLRDWLGDWVGTFIGHKGAVWSSRLSHSSTRALTGSADFSSKVWDTSSGDCLLTLSHPHIVRCVDLSPDASKGVTGCNDGKIRIWDLNEGGDAQHGELMEGGLEGGKTLRSVLWNDEGREVIGAGEDGSVRWWDIRSKKLVHSITSPNSITSMDRSHDQDFISLTTGKQVIFLDLRTRQPRLNHTLPYSPSTASFNSRLRDRFVTGSVEDGWVRVHNASTGEELEVYKGHHGPIHCVQYSPDFECYASGSEDGTIRLWQTTPKNYGLWRLDESNGNS